MIPLDTPGPRATIALTAAHLSQKLDSICCRHIGALRILDCRPQHHRHRHCVAGLHKLRGISHRRPLAVVVPAGIVKYCRRHYALVAQELVHYPATAIGRACGPTSASSSCSSTYTGDNAPGANDWPPRCSSRPSTRPSGNSSRRMAQIALSAIMQNF